MSDRKALMIGVVIGGLLIACLCCLLVVGIGSYFLLEEASTTSQGDNDSFDSSTPVPTPFVIEATGVPEAYSELGGFTYETLDNIIVPEANPGELAERLLGVDEVPETYPDPDIPHQIGEVKEFWVTDTSQDENFQTTAVLQYVTPHSYFWVGEDVSFDPDELEALAETFEEDIYPKTREFFGSEWTPGIDGDEHIYILYVRGIGSNTAGYFSSADSYHPLAQEYSNGHEMFVFNADNSPLRNEYTYSTLAHEFQHMIHWYRDKNETSWVNEGFSEVSTLLNGYDPGGFDYLYLSNPDWQLNDWPNDQTQTAPQYGSSFLFMTYFLERMGEEATQTLVAHPENGLKSIDATLAELDAVDPLSGEPIQADDLVVDWAVTNFLLDPDVADGRFDYRLYRDAFQTDATESVQSCSLGKQPRNVHQYGVDYIQIECQGEFTLRFEGAPFTSLLPADAYSGDYSFWSNKGDESDMTLTQTFDFSDVSGPLTLRYWTWYDIEEDWDYVYVLASSDNGQTWDMLETAGGTATDPVGNNYGFGYTGLSDGGPDWTQEEVDLSAYAGGEVVLRFEYVTDAAVNGEGLLLDDVEIPEIGYFSDFEEDAGGWEGAGFVRVANVLPQTFRLALITRGEETEVSYYHAAPGDVVEIPLNIGGDVEDVVLVVLGTTRFTRQLANYQFDFVP